MDLNTPPNPVSQIPSDAPLTQKHKHKEFFYLAIAVVIIAGGIIWWQINSYSQDVSAPSISPTPTLSPEVSEMNSINDDIQDADVGDLDAEFKEIDGDLDNL